MAKHTPIKQNKTCSNHQQPLRPSAPHTLQLNSHNTGSVGWQYSYCYAHHAQQQLLRRPSFRSRSPLSPAHTPGAGSPTQQLGKYYEQRAAQLLRQRGYQILHHQRLYRHAEIDLIAWLDPYLVLVEVRYRKHNRYGGALGSINHRKKHRLYRAARYAYQEYQKLLPHKDFLLRLDIIAFEGQQVHWIPNAITYESIPYSL